jgi:hypothetical protein
VRLRNAFWILVMLAAPAFVLAQETQQSQPPKPPEKPATEAQKAPEQPAPAQTPAAKLRAQFPPAPKPGHPLDPADVDVLTGKNKSANPYGPYGTRVVVDPYSGFGYPMSGSRFGQSTLDMSGEFPTPRAFSLRNSRAGMPILFLNHGSNRSFIFLGRGISFF